MIFDETDIPVPVGDHFDGLADALRLADKQGINTGIVLITGLQDLAGQTNMSSRDIVINLAGTARQMANEKVVVELAEREAREYISKFTGYIGTLPLAIQNEMRRELEERFKALIK